MGQKATSSYRLPESRFSSGLARSLVIVCSKFLFTDTLHLSWEIYILPTECEGHIGGKSTRGLHNIDRPQRVLSKVNKGRY